jgi:hypothetical protein
MIQHFTKQIEQGTTEMFFYALENADQTKVEIKSHKGTLDTFPDLEYIRHLSESVPLFKGPQ